MNKDEKLQITKNRLLEATMYLMENSDDPLMVTSRQIAARAQVQPAMINYCFGSRENLIYSVFQEQYMDLLKDTKIEDILKSDLSPDDVLKKIHFVVARCLIRNHKFTKAITGYVLFKRDLSKESFSYPYVMKFYGNKKTEAECRLIAYELSTMMQLIVYRKDDMKRDFGIDLDDEKVLEHYVNMRVDLLLQK